MKRVLLILTALMLLSCIPAFAAAYEVGDSVMFGSYEQDNDFDNGKEPIEWIVVNREEDGSFLLMSRYALDRQPYKAEGTEDNWDTSLLRTWLNGAFFEEAFTAEEQESILLTPVLADNAEMEGYDAGEDTMDKVFVFGWTQSSEYVSDTDYEFCAPTAYAIANGVWQSEDVQVDGTGACWYWLRSADKKHIAIYSPGYGVNREAIGVRPVIRVIIE